MHAHLKENLESLDVRLSEDQLHLSEAGVEACADAVAAAVRRELTETGS